MISSTEYDYDQYESYAESGYFSVGMMTPSANPVRNLIISEKRVAEVEE